MFILFVCLLDNNLYVLVMRFGSYAKDDITVKYMLAMYLLYRRYVETLRFCKVSFQCYVVKTLCFLSG